jgi:mono/diheme cytochrome c family protein
MGGSATVVDLRDKTVRTVSLGGRHDQEVDDLRKELLESVGTGGKAIDPLALRKLRETLAEVERKHAEADDGYGRRVASHGYAIARTVDPPGRVLLPQVMVDVGGRERRTPGYGEEHLATVVSAVAVIDEGVGYPFQASLRVNYQATYMSGMERPERCLLPRAADVDAGSRSILVCCLGSDLLVAYDAMSPDPASAERRRWRVAAGPNGVAVDHFDHRAVVWSQFERTLNVIPLGGAQLELVQDADQEQVRRIALLSHPERALPVTLALGRALFHATGDARIAQDGRACANCHPEGRDDGLVWATPNGPRRSPMLAGRLAGSEPYGWDGRAVSLRAQLRQEFLRLGGVGGLRGLELDALVAYLESLSAPPHSPRAEEEAKRRRGAEIFSSKQAGCSDCHAGPATTDKKLHDVKSRTRADRRATFDTPSLRSLSAHPPYFHDGRYASLRALLEGVDGTMGHTKHLTDEDLEALRLYLESL